MRGWTLIKFAPFSTSVVCTFCNKTVNGNNALKKTSSSGKSLISTYSFFGGGSGKGVGAYLSLSGSGREVGCGGGGRLLLFSAFRMGANWRWALIRGWALIRINTVSNNSISRKGPLISLAGLTSIISSLILVLFDETRHNRYPL